MKNRVVRVCEVLKRELSTYIAREIQFQGVLLTVCDVDMTPDLKQAHVYISALGTSTLGKEALQAKVLARLEQHRIDIQSEISRRVALKNTPHLYFYFDDSIARGTRVLQIMNELGLDIKEQEDIEENQNEEK